MYDAAVVMGSGFGPDGDVYGNARLRTALACVKQKEAKNLVLTGSLETRKGALKAYEMAKEDLPFEKIKIARDLDSFSTEGDATQAIKIAQENNFKTLLIITEKPHWFRVRYFFKKKMPKLLIKHRISRSAPVWYWIKEVIACLALFFGENSNLYRFVRFVWKRISPLKNPL